MGDPAFVLQLESRLTVTVEAFCTLGLRRLGIKRM